MKYFLVLAVLIAFFFTQQHQLEHISVDHSSECSICLVSHLDSFFVSDIKTEIVRVYLFISTIENYQPNASYHFQRLSSKRSRAPPVIV